MMRCPIAMHQCDRVDCSDAFNCVHREALGDVVPGSVTFTAAIDQAMGADKPYLPVTAEMIAAGDAAMTYNGKSGISHFVTAIYRAMAAKAPKDMLDASCRSMAEDWANVCMKERDTAISERESARDAMRFQQARGDRLEGELVALRESREPKHMATWLALRAERDELKAALSARGPDYLSITKEFG